MVKRKILIYMCLLFVTIQIILLAEQEILITNRNAVPDSPNSFSLKTSNVTRYEEELVHNINHLTMPKNITLIPVTTSAHINRKEASISKGFNMFSKPNDTVAYKDAFRKHRNKTKSKRILKNIKSSMNQIKKSLSEFKKKVSSQNIKMKSRLDRAEKYCHENRVEGNVDRVLVNPSHAVTYCLSHKVASTHWLRVFRFLWTDKKRKNIESPANISKMEAHFSRSNALKDLSYSNDKDAKLIRNTWRFMFVRDPYIRLWSVFIDKFILADNYFLKYHGPRIAQVNDLQILPARKPCYHFSFLHFINYVIATSKDYSSMDDHIKPLSKLCNPCVFKPNFIGKVESMRTDNQVVLSVLGVNWTETNSTINDHVYDEIKTIIDFNYYIVQRMRLLTWCFNPVTLSKRILRGFVLNGYISESDELSLSNDIPSNKEELLDTVWKVYQLSNRTHTIVKQQREKYRHDAYKTIPIELLLQLQTIYHDDFDLFDYRLDPPEIFYNRSEY